MKSVIPQVRRSDSLPDQPAQAHLGRTPLCVFCLRRIKEHTEDEWVAHWKQKAIDHGVAFGPEQEARAREAFKNLAEKGSELPQK